MREAVKPPDRNDIFLAFLAKTAILMVGTDQAMSGLLEPELRGE
jgi:hypothetical protein